MYYEIYFLEGLIVAYRRMGLVNYSYCSLVGLGIGRLDTDL